MKNKIMQYLEDYNSLKNPIEEQSQDFEAEPGILTGDYPSLFLEENSSGDIQDQKTLKKLLNKLNRHSDLKSYHIDANDLAIISGIYQRIQETYNLDFFVEEILGFLPNPLENLNESFHYLLSLVDRGILSFSYPPEQDFHADLKFVLENRYRLNGLFGNILLGNSPIKSCKSIIIKGFSTNQDRLEIVCKALKQLFNHYPELRLEQEASNGIYYGKEVNQVLDFAVNKMVLEQSNHSLGKFIETHKLDCFWQKCLFLIYFHQIWLDKTPSLSTLAALLASNEIEHQSVMEKLLRHNELENKGFLEFSELGLLRFSHSLNDATLSELMGTESNEEFDLQSFIAKSPFFTLMDTRQTMKQLILPEQHLENIKNVLSRLKSSQNDGLAGWGLLAASLSGDESVQNGSNILLHGAPGTGKTFIAGVLANELERPLILINANNIRDMYYGNTEKRARAMFRDMRLIAEKANPVFLLNEGDQLIHKRSNDLERSVDVAENSIQSIFLEEMEVFSGTLLVTSNIAQNLDPAMSRRFHYKLEIPIPDADCRLKLWEIHLPASIPGAERLDLEALASEFTFTGGQIRLVVQNACYAAISRGPQTKLSMDDLYRYSRLEQGSSFEGQSKTIGF